MDFAVSIWIEMPADLGMDWELLDNLTDEKLQGIELQIDEIWLFVDRKQNKRLIWVACCPATKQVPAFYIGRLGKVDVQQLLDKLPARLRQN
ncbi:hypothetical protein [Lewinella sp. IMCC34191]|uniref:hypothetical protein n=1 Tax=Lewinella sp. IMCC34191 TaxID=2259172 RepID=UPI000E23CFFB|nr:hypothetical protein [Lewinella sp. IMCC34191]